MNATAYRQRLARLSRCGLIVLLAALVPRLSASDADTLRRAVDVALAGAERAVQAMKLPAGIRTIAVIPLRGDDDGYVTARVRDLISGTDYALCTRDDRVWQDLMAEIRDWTEKRTDIMNPETVQKFGKIEGVDAILYGTVWDKSVNLWSIRGHVKLSLALADVETGRELWRSGPLEGEAFIHWSDALMQFWRFPALLFVALMMIGFVLFAFGRLRRAYKLI